MFLFFIAFPISEIFFSLWVVDEIGFLESVYWVLLAFFFGLFLLRTTGMSFLMEIQTQAQSGQTANRAALRAALRFLAAILLMIPGMLSDVFAGSLLVLSFVPWLDRLFARWLQNAFKSRVVFTSAQGPFRHQQTYQTYNPEDLRPEDFMGPRPMRDVTPQKPDELPESSDKD